MMWHSKLKPLAGYLPLLLLLAGPVLAIDGVLEINQAKVDGNGGFPFLIDEPGSYRLTSNLSVPDADRDGIVITASHVTLDLNGFTINATNIGLSVGVFGSGTNVWVMNGTIYGFAINAIRLTNGGGVEDVTVLGSGHTGIQVEGDYCVVRNCTVAATGASGIDAETGLIIDNTTLGASGHGIQTFRPSVVKGNACSQNSATGIVATDSTVVGNRSSANGTNGISCDNCAVIGNTSVNNTGYGFSIAGAVAYAGNAMTGNTVGAVNGAGVQVGANLCNATTCP